MPEATFFFAASSPMTIRWLLLGSPNPQSQYESNKLPLLVCKFAEVAFFNLFSSALHVITIYFPGILDWLLEMPGLTQLVLAGVAGRKAENI
jgi:hypothetical protein